MAAITTFITPGNYKVIRSAVGTSQTDWLAIPAWASAVQVYLDVTTAGTSTALTISEASPALKDDAQVVVITTGATVTAASNHVYFFGPSIATTGTDNAASDGTVAINRPVPAILGLAIAATGSTYTLAVRCTR